MPKLNVQQNNQNVIQAFKNALAIGNLKGIIASDGSHNFSTAGSNRNLLDNPFFTVRQRGDGPFTSAGYTVDRWTMTANATVTAESGGLHFVAAQTYRGFSQYLETPANLAGLTVTLSVDITSLNGGFYVRLYNGAGSPFETHQFSEGLNSFTFTVPANGLKEVYFTNISATSCDVLIHAVKLELGSVSTLANDVPPEYGEELLKCLRYQWIVNAESVYGVVGDATVTTQNTEAMMVVHYPVPMNKVPTLSVSGAFRTVGGNGSTVQVGSVTSMAVTSNASNKNFARVTINGTTMGGTGTSVVVGANGAGAKLIFDANI